MKKFFSIVIYPFTWLANLGIAEKIENLFRKHNFLIYLVALLLTALYIFLLYMLPNLRG